MWIKTPYSVKVRVIKGWIQGISRDQIASNNEIGAGTVTSLIQEVKSNHLHYDMDMVRDCFITKKRKYRFELFCHIVV